MEKPNMKSYILFFLIPVFFACGNDNSELQKSKPSSAPATASVEDLMQAPTNFLNQPISVRGVVSKHGKTPNVFLLISDEEFAKCGLTNCAEFELPVRVDGGVPAIGDSIIVEGTVHRENDKLAFVATDFRLRP